MDVGDRGVLTRALLDQNQRWLTAYFLSVTGSPTDADDLTQEVFATALANIGKYDPSRPLGAWLRGIARNHLHEFIRRSRRAFICATPAALAELGRAAGRLEAESIDPGHMDRRRSALERCMSALTDRARKAIDLRYSRGKPSRAIAAECGMSVPAVNMLLVRARQALEACISEKLEAAR